MQKGVGQSGLPVVGMDDLRNECRDRALADLGRRSRQRRKTARIVGPVRAVRPNVGVSGTCEQMWRVEYEQVELSHRTAENARGSAITILQVENFNRSGNDVKHVRIARYQRARLDPFSFQRRRQGTRHIGEATGLDKRKNLRGDRKHANRLHADSLSIIGWVIRQMPCSVRRNRWASLPGSSPTTNPSGICTPRSMMTFFNRVPRPIST